VHGKVAVAEFGIFLLIDRDEFCKERPGGAELAQIRNDDLFHGSIIATIITDARRPFVPRPGTFSRTQALRH
jgi:hypothetical protein